MSVRTHSLTQVTSTIKCHATFCCDTDTLIQLPYGTMTDDEMRAMPIPTLQDEGLLFLWVTGRAMEVGRECLRVWGYTRVDEVVWVKTNQVHILTLQESKH